MSANFNLYFKYWTKHPVVWLLIVVLLIFSGLSSQFFSLSNFVNILIQGSSLAIIAIGMTFVLLTAGIDLSVGSIMFLAGVISGKLVVVGFPLLGACILVLVIGFLFGLVNAFFIWRMRLMPFIVTLATLFIGRGVGLLISKTRAVNLPESFLQIGSANVLGIPFPILILIIVLVVAHVVLTRTPFGRQIYAVGDNVENAHKAGIPVGKILIWVYIICATCAALGGLVSIAQLGAISPTFGFQREFMAIAAAVLGGTSLFGGRGHVFPGTVVGAMLIQSIETGLVIVNADPYLYPLITGSIIFLIVMVDSLKHKRLLKLKRLKPRF